MLDTTTRPPVNGIDLAALDDTVAAVSGDARLGQVAFRVTTDWKGQTKSESTVDSYTLAPSPAKPSRAASPSSPTSRTSCSAPTPPPTRRSF
jgi:hypothetical protein